MELKVTTFARSGPVAVVSLNRPERLNAWTGRMHAEYRWAIAEAEADAAVGAIVVTGEGRGFCAGADARALEGHIAKGGYDPGTPDEMANPGYGVSPEYDRNFAFHFGLTKPVIAAINGPAAGVGLVLACYCDIRFAAAGAKLTTAHGKLGLPAEYGLSWLLPRLVGLARALELLLSSRVFLAEEALAMGLVHRITAPEDLREAALAYATELARHVSPASLRETKAAIYRDLHGGVGESVDASERLLRSMAKGPEFEEGVRALTEKRLPRFRQD
ncbi:MAG: enoyl-CoA hydratase-related protein [Dehalococcoidia bacterium]